MYMYKSIDLYVFKKSGTDQMGDPGGAVGGDAYLNGAGARGIGAG